VSLQRIATRVSKNESARIQFFGAPGRYIVDIHVNDLDTLEGECSVNRFAVKRWLQSVNAGRERGASLIEYVLLVSLIAVVVIGAVTFFGGSVNDMFSSSGSKLSGM
jgi:pilus assembly protein Flp/PilA